MDLRNLRLNIWMNIQQMSRQSLKLFFLSEPGKNAGNRLFLWSLAAPSLLAMKETVERIEDLAEASETVRQALYAGTLPTDTEILNDVQEPDDDLIETEPVSSG